MNKELQTRLFEKYPEIFKQKDLTPQETCMCWGITCGDGWHDLIDELCGEIQNRVDNVNRNRKYKLKNSQPSLVPVSVEEFICEAVQVKEKWGGLRFYVCGGDEFIQGAISLAESLSLKTCEICGKPGKLTNKNWIKVRCDNCHDRIREG